MIKKTYSLEIHNLKKIIDGNVILNNINAHFKRQEVSVIIGPSGIGKSILLKCILQLTNKDAGEIKFNDTNHNKDKNNNTASIGMLSQSPILYTNKTVYDNVKFSLDLYPNFQNLDKDKIVKKCLKQVNISEENYNKYPLELSGGMQKKLGLAIAIVYKPKYLFCDEHDSGLDPENAVIINQLIKDITIKNKMTTVIVSHNLETLIKIGTHVVFLDKTSDGTETLWEGDINEMIYAENAYLEKFLNANSLYNKYKENLINKTKNGNKKR